MPQSNSFGSVKQQPLFGPEWMSLPLQPRHLGQGVVREMPLSLDPVCCADAPVVPVRPCLSLCCTNQNSVHDVSEEKGDFVRRDNVLSTLGNGDAHRGRVARLGAVLCDLVLGNNIRLLKYLHLTNRMGQKKDNRNSRRANRVGKQRQELKLRTPVSARRQRRFSKQCRVWIIRLYESQVRPSKG